MAFQLWMQLIPLFIMLLRLGKVTIIRKSLCDLTKAFDCMIIYADDVTIYTSNINLDVINVQMNEALDNAAIWFHANYLSLNIDKTQSLVLTLKDTKQELNSAKLLGFNLDPKLTWEMHTTNICSILSRIIFLIRAIKNKLPKECTRNVYFALFQT
ncbi:hypothetical protein J437_LFUL002974 [Ladona fulva]|uniref:Reverse transcriptase domain-containing protein n=1 Tax=Ladona fulva TaxID=123851 RepID=A0A8K0K9M9_LADFU|nr:hypothetical protein J437_LFUL002974 [Ladona fulva]